MSLLTPISVSINSQKCRDWLPFLSPLTPISVAIKAHNALIINKISTAANYTNIYSKKSNTHKGQKGKSVGEFL